MLQLHNTVQDSRDCQEVQLVIAVGGILDDTTIQNLALSLMYLNLANSSCSALRIPKSYNDGVMRRHLINARG